MFLAFQYPTAIPGLSVASFLRTALNAKHPGRRQAIRNVDPTDLIKGGGINMGEFRRLMREKMALLKLDDAFAARYVNEGFSGGEKKRLEMLQMAVLEPKMAILDETDSGLDIDALRIVAEGVNAQLNPDLGVLLITHYQRLLNYITPDVVHVLAPGRIIKTGGRDLALRLEDEGYGADPARGRPRGRRPGRGAATAGRAGRGRELAMAVTPQPDRRAQRPGRHGVRRARSVTQLDPDALRADFPILPARLHAAARWSTSTRRRRSQKPRSCSTRSTATTASTTPTSIAASTRSARRRPPPTRRRARTIARFINAPDPHEIVFARNATEAINLVAYSWGRRNIERGDTIVLTEMEHHANLVPWQLLAQEKDARPRVRADRRRRPPAPGRLRGPAPDSSRSSSRSPMCRTASARSTRPRDGRHGPRGRRARPRSTAPRPCRTCRSTSRTSAADFYVFSGHKMLGADGLRRALGAPRAARGDAAVPGRRRDDPRGPPAPQRRGTTSPGSSRRARRTSRAAIGLGAAARLPDGAGHGRASAPTSTSSSTTRWTLLPASVPAIQLHGPLAADERGGVVTSTCRASTRTTSRQVLDRVAIAIRAGHHCTMPLHERLDEAATARASFNVYTDRDDIDAWSRALHKVVRHLRRRRRPPRPHPRRLETQSMDDLYRDEILEHYRRPAQLRHPRSADASTRARTRCAATASR